MKKTKLFPFVLFGVLLFTGAGCNYTKNRECKGFSDEIQNQLNSKYAEASATPTELGRPELREVFYSPKVDSCVYYFELWDRYGMNQQFLRTYPEDSEIYSTLPTAWTEGMYIDIPQEIEKLR